MSYEQGWTTPPTSRRSSWRAAALTTTDTPAVGAIGSEPPATQRRARMSIFSLAHQWSCKHFASKGESPLAITIQGETSYPAAWSDLSEVSSSIGSISSIDEFEADDAAERERRRLARMKRWTSSGHMKLTAEFRSIDQSEAAGAA